MAYTISRDFAHSLPTGSGDEPQNIQRGATAMSKESAIRFLREMRSNEKTKDLLQGLGNPESIEDKIKACAKIAHALGEDVSYEDLADALEEIEAGIRHKAEAVSSDIAELEDEDVENVAGGDGWCWSDYWCVMFVESPCVSSSEKNKIKCGSKHV